MIATQPGVTDSVDDQIAVNTTTTVPADGTSVPAPAPEPKEPEPTERQKVMDAIAASNLKRLEEEHTKEGLVLIPKEAKELGEVKPDDPDGQLAAQLDDARILSDDELGKVKVKTKIDGVETLVSLADLKREYQKNGAADRRLDEATRLLQEARAMNATATAPPVVGDVKAKVGDSPATQPAAVSEEAGKEFLSALFEGDETKAMDALKKILPAQGGSTKEPTPLDMDQIAAQLTPAIKQRLAEESALDKFAKDFDDVLADPHLATLADGYLEAVVKEEPSLSYSDALTKAGGMTRDWLASKGVKASAGPSPTTERAKKLERKSGVDVLPGLNVRATVIETPPQSTSDVIAEMRKARGLE